jgi:hypothetical protein
MVMEMGYPVKVSGVTDAFKQNFDHGRSTMYLLSILTGWFRKDSQKEAQLYPLTIEVNVMDKVKYEISFLLLGFRNSVTSSPIQKLPQLETLAESSDLLCGNINHKS